MQDIHLLNTRYHNQPLNTCQGKLEHDCLEFNEATRREIICQRLLWLSSCCSLLPLIWIGLLFYRVESCAGGACGQHFYWYESMVMLAIGPAVIYAGPGTSLVCLLITRFKLKNDRYRWHAVLLAPWLIFYLHEYFLSAFQA